MPGQFHECSPKKKTVSLTQCVKTSVCLCVQHTTSSEPSLYHGSSGGIKALKSFHYLKEPMPIEVESIRKVLEMNRLYQQNIRKNKKQNSRIMAHVTDVLCCNVK